MTSSSTMKAMVLEKPGTPLSLRECAVPEPGAGQVLIQVLTCAICRTDLHVVDCELPNPKLPLIIGHEVVGRVVSLGPGVNRPGVGERVGVPWLGWACGECVYCKAGTENLCDRARFTGYTIDGGYAEYTVADARFCVLLPAEYSDASVAPLLCAGLIGFRSLVRAGDGKRLGIYGFGAAAHIITQVAIHQGRTVYAFTRPGDSKGQQFARSVGASWAGGSDERAPEELDAAIIFAPAGPLVPVALAGVRKGGTVVCGGIHMSDIPSFPYELLWGERTICSVANLTRADGAAFMRIAPKVPVRTTTHTFALEQANDALNAVRNGQLEGAAVLAISGPEKK
jgi:propanol-preferring alcohol dehydrogenase